MLEKEFQYYLDNQETLVKLYSGKYIVIVGEKVVGAYDSKQEAYDKSSEEMALGTFLIQHCLPGKSSHTQTYHSRVIINRIAQ